MAAIRIDTARIADGIGLVDAFRAAGFAAGLADVPGTWDVEVDAPLDDVASALLEWMERNGRELMLAHADGRAYLVALPSAALVA
jgi:hypothetical protein